MHTLRLHLEERSSTELMVLREASIANARTKLITHLDTLQAAGRALGWVRQAAPGRTSEPSIYEALTGLLDRLNRASPDLRAPVYLAEFGLFLLSALGFGIRLRQCVRCGRNCAEGRAAHVDARRGGLVCRACGGAKETLGGAARERMACAAEGQIDVLEEPDTDAALALVEQALQAHMT
jgi:DNA repair protein RecO (recombination protein O)